MPFNVFNSLIEIRIRILLYIARYGFTRIAIRWADDTISRDKTNKQNERLSLPDLIHVRGKEWSMVRTARKMGVLYTPRSVLCRFVRKYCPKCLNRDMIKAYLPNVLFSCATFLVLHMPIMYYLVIIIKYYSQICRINQRFGKQQLLKFITS